MKRVLFLPLLILTRLFVHAQSDCRSAEYKQQLIANSPGIIGKIAAIEAFTQQLQKDKTTTLNGSGSSISQPSSEIVIPVVVHIVYNSSQQNISNAQVQSQIDVLNKDYNRMNADSNNTPAVFRPVAANC